MDSWGKKMFKCICVYLKIRSASFMFSNTCRLPVWLCMDVGMCCMHVLYVHKKSMSIPTVTYHATDMTETGMSKTYWQWFYPMFSNIDWLLCLLDHQWQISTASNLLETAITCLKTAIFAIWFNLCFNITKQPTSIYFF